MGVTVGHNGVIHFDAGPETPAILAAAARLESAGVYSEVGMAAIIKSEPVPACIGLTCAHVHVHPKQHGNEEFIMLPLYVINVRCDDIDNLFSRREMEIRTWGLFLRV